ncbi:phage tail protein X [Salmonella enterica subsp. enterica]|uniref:Phage tail protein X n=1 Tax=Salmonella enterica I TaxID=59201 RepID=A0A3S4F0C0_SALET|nr:phage tail protein X [Salmonella enterica subsp. enterica]
MTRWTRFAGVITGTQGVTEQVLQANPGLAEYGPFLPHGLQVELPDITASTTAQTVQLWD